MYKSQLHRCYSFSFINKQNKKSCHLGQDHVNKFLLMYLMVGAYTPVHFVQVISCDFPPASKDILHLREKAECVVWYKIGEKNATRTTNTSKKALRHTD